MKKDNISVFLPFYNEEEIIEEFALECYDFLKQLDRDFELLLIDDGSTDKTGFLVDKLEDNKEEIRALHHERNQGYGSALRLGFKEAKYPLIFYTDGDAQFDISDLERFLNLAEYDAVIGYREDRKDKYSRVLIGNIFNSVTRLILPINTKDIDCGFKLFDREVIDKIDLKTKRTVDAELIAKINQKGFEIKQLPVKHSERTKGESEAEGLIGVRISLIIKTIRELIQIRQDIK